MKRLFIVTAIFEGITGLALVVSPALFVWTLLGASLTEPSGLLVSRLAGSALLSLAIICWMLRSDPQPGGMLKALLFYNLAAAALLIYAAWGYRMIGLGIWPAALLHAILAGWCLLYLQRSSTPKKPKPKEK